MLAAAAIPCSFRAQTPFVVAQLFAKKWKKWTVSSRSEKATGAGYTRLRALHCQQAAPTTQNQSDCFSSRALEGLSEPRHKARPSARRQAARLLKGTTKALRTQNLKHVRWTSRNRPRGTSSAPLLSNGSSSRKHLLGCTAEPASPRSHAVHNAVRSIKAARCRHLFCLAAGRRVPRDFANFHEIRDNYREFELASAKSEPLQMNDLLYV